MSLSSTLVVLADVVLVHDFIERLLALILIFDIPVGTCPFVSKILIFLLFVVLFVRRGICEQPGQSSRRTMIDRKLCHKVSLVISNEERTSDHCLSEIHVRLQEDLSDSGLTHKGTARQLTPSRTFAILPSECSCARRYKNLS